MKIIREFTPRSPKMTVVADCQIGSGSFSQLHYFPIAETGIILVDDINPLLATYFGVEFIGSGVEIALHSESTPMRFDGTNWVAAGELTYVSVQEVLDAIGAWTGLLRIYIRIRQGGYLFSVKIGYEVLVEPFDYLMNILQAQLGDMPLRISRSALLNADGTVTLPTGLNSDVISSVVAVPIPRPLPATSINNVLTVGTVFPFPVELQFDLQPAIERANEAAPHQVSVLPAVVIRPLRAVGQSYLSFDQIIQTSVDAWEVGDSVMYVEDKPVEVKVYASQEVDARALSRHLQRNFPRYIYAPAFDLDFPLWVDSKLNDMAANYDEYGIAGFTFEVKFLRLPA